MLHRLPIADLGPRGPAMGHAVETCIHCGFCLPTCPTYDLLGAEADSPRGRIMLMKEVLEGNLAAEDAAPHIDRCLGCVACQTHCPSGVEYGALLNAYRSHESSAANQARPFSTRLRRRLASWTLPYPTRFSLAIRLGAAGRRLRRFTPAALRPMLDLIPDVLPAAQSTPVESPATGPERDRVMLHLGCAARVLRPDITAASIRVLNRNGVTVVAPRTQGCCGALPWHIGDSRQAVKLATASLAAFGDGNEPILTTAAGCGSAMHEYGLMLAGLADDQRVQRYIERVIDISVYLERLGITPPPAVKPLRVAYHDACHLAHAQRVRQPPRALLRKIPGVELVELTESDWCCGSAGIYNIDQPELAEQLGQRKVANVIASGCDLVAMGNIGCQVQIEQHLARIGHKIPVLHTIQLLDRAYREVLQS